MALTRPFPVDKAWPNASDLRKELSGLLPLSGMIPDATSLTDTIAFAGSGWAVSARPFVAVLRRGTSAFGLTYGSLLLANDALESAAWTLPGAPTTGSRISRLWIEAVDPTQGGALTTPSGETVARAVPRFGITTGNAATDPIAPTLPAGVFEVAQVTVPSTATSAAQASFGAAYPFAYLNGGTFYARSQAWMDAFAAPEGTICKRLDNAWRFERIGGAWKPIDSPWIDFATTWSSANSPQPAIGNGTISARYRYVGRGMIAIRIELIIGSSTTGGAGSWAFTLPAGITTPGVRQVIQGQAELSGFGFFDGHGLIVGTSVTPYVPQTSTSALMSPARNADSTGASGTSVPQRAGLYSYGPSSRVLLEGVLEVTV